MSKHIFTEKIIIETLDKWPDIHSTICNILDYLAFQIEAALCDPDDIADNIVSISPSELKHAVVDSSKALSIYDMQLKDLIRYVSKNKQLLSDVTIARARSVQQEAELTRSDFENIIDLFNMIYGDLSAKFSYIESEESTDINDFT